MSSPPSSNVAPATFQTPHGKDAISPKQFLDFLSSLVSKSLSDEVKVIREKAEWVIMITGLSEQVYSFFPFLTPAVQETSNERIVLTHFSLDILERVSQKVQFFYDGEVALVKKLFVTLLGLCLSAESWLEVTIHGSKDTSDPSTLFARATNMLVCLLRDLLSSCFRGTAEAGWRLAVELLGEALELTQAILRATHDQFPLDLNLFSMPRTVVAPFGDAAQPIPPGGLHTIRIPSALHLPVLCSLIVDVVSRTLLPQDGSRCLTEHIVRRAAETTRSTFEYCLTCPTSAAVRSRCLGRTAQVAHFFARNIRSFRCALGDLPTLLLLRKLQEGPKTQSALSLRILSSFISHDKDDSIQLTASHAHDILDILAKQDWQEAGAELRNIASSFLRKHLAQLDRQTLRAIQNFFRGKVSYENWQLIVDDITVLQRAEAVDQIIQPRLLEWRAQAGEELKMIFDDHSWMDVDEGLSDALYARRGLEAVKERLERTSQETPESVRVACADYIRSLVTHLSPSLDEEAELCSVSTLFPLLKALMVGPAELVTPSVRRKTYSTLAAVTKHHGGDLLVNDNTTIVKFIQRGLSDKERTTRLSAGRALAELVRTYTNVPGGSWRQAEPLLFHLTSTLDAFKKYAIKETTLMTLGYIGRDAHIEIQGHVVASLISQLGEENPVLRSVAHGELLALAKFHGKAPYGLVSPFLARIAPFVVARKYTKPILLAETCRCMGVHTNDFLSVTLPKTLPYIFANSEIKVLEEISTELGQKPSTLFMNHCHRILSEIFRLQGPGQTNKALTFVLKILTEAAIGSTATIDLQSIVKSCLFPLLAELVVASGDENEEQAASAANALRKVARTMSSVGGDQALSNVDLAAFLKMHMLGVVSNINELLQDVYGKKTISDKRQILRGLGSLIIYIGDAVHNVAPQIMATLQTMFLIPELSDVTLSTWYTFLVTLAAQDVGSHIGATAASLVSSWPSLSATGRETATRCINFIVFDLGDVSGEHLDEMVDLGNIPELLDAHNELKRRRATWEPRERLQKILERSTSDNFTVAFQSLEELKVFMLTTHAEFVRGLASGDTFDPLVGKIQSSLFHIASRDGDASERLRLLAFECMGILGAVDPDRCEFGLSDSRMVVRSNFTDEAESVLFAMHFIKDVLVGAFRSTSDIKYQGQLAYTIQELLKFCNFTPALVSSRNTGTSVPVRVRNRWNSLPKHVLETVTPLLEARFGAPERMPSQLTHPIYPQQNTYREWLQLWTAHLITRASGQTAQRIFGVFRMAVRNKDVGVALHLLPHVVLNILLSGDGKDVQDILSELLTVLEDQVSHDSRSTPDKKFLSAQVVFMLLDHMSKYVRILRQDISSKKADANNKRSRVHHALAESEDQLVRVDSLLSSINHDLMAKAALQCKAYARSLMNFERQIVALRERETLTPDHQLTPYYERLHEIYAHLDEPDGMEGISMLILSPSLEHQIRQHESTGQWTSAQSCWEVRLQQSPDNLEFHLGLLRCLRNLGHYDTLRTHVQGVLLRNPDWESALVGFQAESAWMIRAWDDLQRITSKCELSSPSVMKARVLLSMRSGDRSVVNAALSKARAVLGAPISASGIKGHRRSYDALLDLHMVHELEMIHAAISNNPPLSQNRRSAINALRTTLTDRLESTLPNFRIRESVLSMRRTAFSLSPVSSPSIASEIGRSWLASAKIARKAKQWQTAYSATLQAQQGNARFYFMESAKLAKATGEPLRALQELENLMRLSGIMTDQDTIDLTTEDDAEFKQMRAKAHILLARWMNESGRYDPSRLLKAFSTAANQGTMLESAYYHLGRFHDQCFKQLPSNDDERAIRMNAHTVRDYGKAMLWGSKYVYQAIPRMLTLWLDLGENPKTASHPIFAKINSAVATAIDSIPMYKWFTAFPQIVSRVGHDNAKVYALLSKLISKVIREYPHQALWLFASVVKSTKSNRESRGRAILDALMNEPGNTRNPLPSLILQCYSMTDELLRLCNHPIDDDRKSLSMRREFPKLAALGRSQLFIPLQESLTVNLPPASSTENSTHVPFPTSAPTFEEFSDEIAVMRSLAKPRKITIRGSNGQTYVFLGKPKDDLRKDARLMDFNAIINKLLKANSESRRRQLHIRTYGVVTLNEECGFIQWVPNTVPVRPVLLKYYEARRIRSWSTELSDAFKRIKDASDKDAAELFLAKVLPVFPPVFHEWFVETFPEPSAWLASRLTYGRTAAVMSMVGFILGLGDRHCENILLDTNTGDVVHVDLNCLFEKGKTFETPERVPFRLTQNMIDGLGVTGVEGVFRIACEVTMQLLRDNKDSLMSVLDAFIHDPLVEWEDEKRKIDRERRNAVKSTTDLRHLAKNALRPIERKLRGVYSPSNVKTRTHGGWSGAGDEREISTSNLVQMLIQEAVDDANLAKMYPGWAAWH